jgi:hypothetical protein
LDSLHAPGELDDRATGFILAGKYALALGGAQPEETKTNPESVSPLSARSRCRNRQRVNAKNAICTNFGA